MHDFAMSFGGLLGYQHFSNRSQGHNHKLIVLLSSYYTAHEYTVPPPTLTVSRDPDANTTLRDGDDLTLTCTIQLDDAVDSDVVVTGILQGPTGRNSTIVKTLDSPVQSSPVESKVYQIVLYIPSLRATSSETCTCTASVDPGTGVDSVQSSESHTDSIDITVGK